MSPTAKLIFKGKIFEIQIEIATIAMELNNPSLLNEISKIQIGMHTPMLNEIPKDKIQTEISTIPSLLNEISKIQIGMHTTMLNEIVKGKIFETQIEIGTIPSLLNEIFKIATKIFETQI